MVKTSPYFFLTFPDVQQQAGDSDCGLYTLAFAYTLCSGIDLAKISYKQVELRPHFFAVLNEENN